MKTLNKAEARMFLNTRHSRKREYLYIISTLAAETSLKDYLFDKALVNEALNTFFFLDAKKRFKNAAHSIRLVDKKKLMSYSKKFKLEESMIIAFDNFVKKLIDVSENCNMSQVESVNKREKINGGNGGEIGDGLQEVKLKKLDHWLLNESLVTSDQSDSDLIDFKKIGETLGTNDPSLILEEVERLQASRRVRG